MFDRFVRRLASAAGLWRAYAMVVAVLSLHSSADAQPRPWQPMPKFRLECPSDVAATELDRIVAARRSEQPGMAVALLRDGQPLATRYVGVEDLDRRAVIGPETRFYVASLAKTITATATLMLHERGKLRLEDSLGHWIDGLPACAHGIRLIQLLQHTSGLPDYFDALGDSASGLDNEAVLTFVRGLHALDFEPGLRYAYCNTGYVLLAEVIGRASGVSFASFVEDSMFTPLGMSASTVVRRGMPPIVHRATGYHRDGDGYVRDDLHDQWTVGSGGIYSTLPDVVTWFRAVTASRLLQPSSTALLFETPVTLSGRLSYLGMGWSDETPGPRTPELEGLRAFGSLGMLAGFRAAILFYPDHELAWIALSNAGEGALPPEGMRERLFKRL